MGSRRRVLGGHDLNHRELVAVEHRRELFKRAPLGSCHENYGSFPVHAFPPAQISSYIPFYRINMGTTYLNLKEAPIHPV